MTTIGASAKKRTGTSVQPADGFTRIGIVGSGFMGRLHAQTVSRVASADGNCLLASVMDRHPGRAEAVAEEFGAKATTDMTVALRDVDAVIVCVPTGAHSSLTEVMLEQGRDVLVEKPFAASVAEAKLLAELAQTRGRILQVGHIEWYNQGWRDAIDLVGTPKTIDVERLSRPSDRGLDIDVVQDFMLHDLDWVTRLLGEEIVDLKARGTRVINDKLDEATVELVFRGGCRVNLHASRVDEERRRIVRISGSKGSATGDLLMRRLEGTSSTIERGPDPLEAQLRDFLHSVQTREEPAADASVGIAVLELVDRVRHAIEQESRSSDREDGSALRG